jgi:Flp pilus assembly protein TadB
MNSILEPLLAILAIVAPLGLAYAILLWQSRKPACARRKASATARDDLLRKRAELSRAEEKQAAR